MHDVRVERGYLEDLCYTPKTLKAVAAVRAGQIGEVTWVRSRETHPGPHSSWFWDKVEVTCWTDTLVHPIEAEDNAIALNRFESGAIGPFEVSWSFRGGMDLRDEVAGTEATVWLNHFLRTGIELFASGAGTDYVAEKAESSSGWLFPVGDEVAELGYSDMSSDMFDAIDDGRSPRETFYDGYVVNAVMDACYRAAASKRWEPVDLDRRDGAVARISTAAKTIDGLTVIKKEVLPDGRTKVILRDPATGELSERAR
jgi:predicted dehydrogenase